MAHALAYYDTATIMAIKSFIVQAPTNVRLNCKCLPMKNTTAYCSKAETLS
jgi:hypothetical protein